MRHAAVLAPALAVLLTAAPALAGGPPGTVAPGAAPALAAETPAPIVKRYGTHVLLADAAWIGATWLLASSEGGSEDGASLVALGYYIGGPAVHLAHGNSTGALKSLGARTLLPVAGGVVGGLAMSNADDDPEGMGAFYGLMLGAAVGAGTAMVLDWTIFPKKEIAPSRLSFAGRLRPNLELGRERVS